MQREVSIPPVVEKVNIYEIKLVRSSSIKRKQAAGIDGNLCRAVTKEHYQANKE